ncbi:four helix bundle protein [Candidatus Uhrbacteria bacterium]|jgi:four helix bundle protein|nr:four helix bundle protein [Candidatus Uhrbacteria bacterium]MBT7716989.1 four helix bundle protein [Candidatus Uhrbacteria bacterium]
MKFNYERMDITSDVHKLIREVYQLSCIFPDDEKFNLVSQVKRASTSVLLNIAEGSSRRSAADYRRFVIMAIGSAVELDAVLKLAISIGYLTQDEYLRIEPMIKTVYFKLIKLRKSLEKKTF